MGKKIETRMPGIMISPVIATNCAIVKLNTCSKGEILIDTMLTIPKEIEVLCGVQVSAYKVGVEYKFVLSSLIADICSCREIICTFFKPQLCPYTGDRFATLVSRAPDRSRASTVFSNVGGPLAWTMALISCCCCLIPSS